MSESDCWNVKYCDRLHQNVAATCDNEITPLETGLPRLPSVHFSHKLIQRLGTLSRQSDPTRGGDVCSPNLIHDPDLDIWIWGRVHKRARDHLSN